MYVYINLYWLGSMVKTVVAMIHYAVQHIVSLSTRWGGIVSTTSHYHNSTARHNGGLTILEQGGTHV